MGGGGKCGRASIPTDQNTGAFRDLGIKFVPQMRLLDKDGFVGHGELDGRGIGAPPTGAVADEGRRKLNPAGDR
ncbi:hypothetical protein ACPCBX_03515 [Streptomyces tuirus]|uniref:Uncharacterized protein n=1 Tax=Streptomyces tuirus TaxID=68278 RepID=A0A7G1NLL0_9ACTN|nr:hypothetical protein [Streptomyces tuirus]BCL24123.1 hypothetical protein GCM10017668_59660 [Streptomyces tuirus]